MDGGERGAQVFGVAAVGGAGVSKCGGADCAAGAGRAEPEAAVRTADAQIAGGRSPNLSFPLST